MMPVTRRVWHEVYRVKFIACIDDLSMCSTTGSGNSSTVAVCYNTLNI